ncbi:ABC transporter ATP-binding protein [Deferrisoma camini]|uniref:ABC transporter ATP-binding protein n=1 Tax=Deferrisoma camini TaxID=1035120 RepID=UPI00046D93E8|nr:ABC transporter ATP-binding protein [Deferrisoma camini]
MSYLIAENLTKRYGSGDAAVLAVRGMTFSVEQGEFVAVMGESGSGKSTLLSILGALNTPTEGRYLVDDIDVYGLDSERQADFRREFLGFVFQSFHLVPYLTLAENVMLPLATVKAARNEKRRMAIEALDRVGLGGKADRLPSQVSGGEQERVAIARAIVNDPPILLADEPTGNLDTKTSQEIMGLLTRLNQEGTTVVMVTHSPDCAAYARRILRVVDGRVVEEDRIVRETALGG